MPPTSLLVGVRERKVEEAKILWVDYQCLNSLWRLRAEDYARDYCRSSGINCVLYN